MRYAMLSFVAFLTAFPFYVMIVLALREPGPIILPDALIPTNISFDAITRVLGSNSMGKWFINSMIYSVVSVVIVLLLASLAGYAFAKLRFPGRNALFWVILATIMVPFHLSLIPVFLMVANLQLVDTITGMMLPGLAGVQALFLMRQFIRGLPDELFDAGRIDGASDLRLWWSIVLPLTKPVLATMGVFTFLWHWNDFLWPLVIAHTDASRPLTVGLATLQREQVTVSEQMAGAFLSFIPAFLVFLVLQRYLVRGISMSGVKG